MSFPPTPLQGSVKYRLIRPIRPNVSTVSCNSYNRWGNPSTFVSIIEYPIPSTPPACLYPTVYAFVVAASRGLNQAYCKDRMSSEQFRSACGKLALWKTQLKRKADLEKLLRHHTLPSRRAFGVSRFNAVALVILDISILLTNSRS